MRYYYKLVQHFLCSNSRHGTHSPFVYRLAEKVIYSKSSSSSCSTLSKAASLMSDIASFYGMPIIEAQTKVKGEGIFKVAIDSLRMEQLYALQKDYFMVLVTGIYTTRQAEKKWQQIVADKATIVTIDLFHFGIVCYRREQPKEHFRLRFPYWKY